MLNKLTDRIYYSDFVEKGDRPVLGLIVGDKYSLVIDGGNSRAHAQKFLNEVSKLDISPLKYLVLTHWHWDHVFGVTTMDLVNLVQEKTNEKLKWLNTLKWTNEDIDKRVKRGEEIEFCSENIKIELPNNHRCVEIPLADIVFKENIRMDLGGININIEHFPCDHSDDCCIIHVEEEKVVFLGDAIYLDMYNEPWSYSKEKLYPLLDKLEQYNANYYIPAHHPKYTKESFKNFSRYIKDIGNIVGKSVELEECIEKFQKSFCKKPTEEEINDLKVFIEGNRKTIK